MKTNSVLSKETRSINTQKAVSIKKAKGLLAVKAQKIDSVFTTSPKKNSTSAKKNLLIKPLLINYHNSTPKSIIRIKHHTTNKLPKKIESHWSPPELQSIEPQEKTT